QRGADQERDEGGIARRRLTERQLAREQVGPLRHGPAGDDRRGGNGGGVPGPFEAASPLESEGDEPGDRRGADESQPTAANEPVVERVRVVANDKECADG